MANQLHEALLRKREVLKLTGWSNSTLYCRMAAKLFARPVRTGPRSVAWLASEVQEYIQKCVAERDGKDGVQ